MEVKKHYITLTKSESNTAVESLAGLIVQHLQSENESHKREVKKLVKSNDREMGNPGDESFKPI